MTATPINLENLADNPPGIVDKLAQHMNTIASHVEDVRKALLKALHLPETRTELIAGADAHAKAEEIKKLTKLLSDDAELAKIQKEMRQKIHDEFVAKLEKTHKVNSHEIDIKDSLEKMAKKLKHEEAAKKNGEGEEKAGEKERKEGEGDRKDEKYKDGDSKKIHDGKEPAPTPEQVGVVNGAGNALALGATTTVGGLAAMNFVPGLAESAVSATQNLNFPAITPGLMFTGPISTIAGWKLGGWLGEKVLPKDWNKTKGGMKVLGGAGGLAASLSAPLAPYVSAAAVVGGGLALSHLAGSFDRWAWNSKKPSTTLGTIGRGLASPFTLPLRLLNKTHEWAWDTGMSDSKRVRLLRAFAPLTVPTGILLNKAPQQIKRIWTGEAHPITKTLTFPLWGPAKAVTGLFKGFFGGFMPKSYEPKGVVENVAATPGKVTRWALNQPMRLWNWLLAKETGTNGAHGVGHAK